MQDKHETLNSIVTQYVSKSHMFHKKANRTFQTLSSMDTEGHTTAERLSKKDVAGDKELHRLQNIDQFNTMSPAEQQRAVYQDTSAQ